MKSPLYWHPVIYDTVLRLVYRKTWDEVWPHLSPWIPAGGSLLDVAAGTGELYLLKIRPLDCHYTALEINSAFVRHMRRRGIDARQGNLTETPLPVVDVVLMLRALYHFKHQGVELVEKLRRASRRHLVILETDSGSLVPENWRARLKARLADMGDGPILERYSTNELSALCRKSGPLLADLRVSPQERLIVLSGAAGR